MPFQTIRRAARTTGDRARAAARRLRRPGRPGRFARLPSEGVVTVEYSPHLDDDPDPGEVVWAWVPFQEDPDQGKDRPVVVIGRRGEHLVGIPLTTKRDDREAQFEVGVGDWDPQRRVSYARIWRLVDFPADTMRREGAILDVDRFEALVRMVDRYYDVKVPAATRRDEG
jgi:hypothetical protein